MVNSRSRSYSPHGHDEFDPDFNICCGLCHSTTAARGFAVYFFLLCVVISGTNYLAYGFDKTEFSIFCILFTIYSLILIFGTFLEKRVLIFPFLIVNGIGWILLLLLTLAFILLGAFTDSIRTHHRNNEIVRWFYNWHGLNPDDEKTQAVVSSSVLIFFIVQLTVFGFGWLTSFRAYRCYQRRDTTLLPGYQKGVVAIDSPE